MLCLAPFTRNLLAVLNVRGLNTPRHHYVRDSGGLGSNNQDASWIKGLVFIHIHRRHSVIEV